MRYFSVTNGCSTVDRRSRMTSGVAHAGSVKMTPTEGDGSRRYMCEGDWNLIRSLTGDVRMVDGSICSSEPGLHGVHGP
jgi:hypothetical protein